MKRTAHILFGVLVFVAVVIRVPRIGEVNYGAGDLGIQLLVAEHTVRYGDVRLDGEISSFEENGKYIIHNSPLGYYLYTVLYLFGGQTPEGYSAVYMLLNVVQAFLLFISGVLLFGVGGGLVALSMALFSPSSLMLSLWPSQPTNAVLVESVALCLLAAYVRTKRSRWLMLSLLTSLVATQLYPPMYLLLPPKIILLVVITRRMNLLFNNRFTIAVLCALIYLPLLAQEWVFRWDNSKTVLAFLRASQGGFPLRELVGRIAINVQMVTSDMGWFSFGSFAGASVTILCVVTALIGRKNRCTLIALITLILFPVLLLAFHSTQPYIVPNRAYLLILFPFVCLFVGGVVAKLPRGIGVFFSCAFAAVALFFYRSYGFDKPSIVMQDFREVAALISANMKAERIQPETIDIFVISPADSWSWDGTIFWYELERQIGKRLSRIDYASSKAKRISVQPASYVYLICHRMMNDVLEQGCQSVFEHERMESVYEQTLRLSSSMRLNNNSIFLYRQ